MFEEFVGVDPAFLEHGLGSALVDDGGVIMSFVFTFDLRKKILDAAFADRVIFCKAVAHSEHDIDERFLVFWFDGEYVEIDALGRPGLVKKPVPIRLLKRRWDGFAMEGF